MSSWYKKRKGMKFGKVTKKQVFADMVGVFLIGVGIAFINCTSLGNDQVGIIYEGIRVFGGMTYEQLGLASNFVNVALTVLLFFVGRKYIQWGTLIYFVCYGFCTDLGVFLYGLMVPSDGMVVRVIFSIIGCLLLYLGVAIYITVDIGVDPFSGVILVLRDILKKEYRFVKMGFDVVLVIAGTLLGGKLGVITVLAMLTAGPMIQYFSGWLQKKGL